jgi:hypothetical protein
VFGFAGVVWVTLQIVEALRRLSGSAVQLYLAASYEEIRPKK